MTKPVVLYIDKTAAHIVPSLAKKGKALGYGAVFVHDAAKTVESPEVFERLIPTTDWSYEGLRKLRDEIAGQYDIKGLYCVHGFFHEDKGPIGGHVARLAEEMGLPSQTEGAVYRANNKYLTRDALRAAGVRTVDFGLATDEASLLEHARRIGFPVVLKPVLGVASSLILKCRDDKELISQFRLALERLPVCGYRDLFGCPHEYTDASGARVRFQPGKSMLVEKYIAGREASVECAISESQIVPLLVHDKLRVEESEKVVYEDLLVVPAVRFTERETWEMREYAMQVVRAVGLKNTLAHVELRYGEEGPQLLEINPRVGGMCVIDSLRTMLGFDAEEAMVRLATGTFTVPPTAPKTPELHAMFALYPDHGGRLAAVDGLETLQGLPGVLDAKLRVPVGTKIAADDEELFLVTCWMRGGSLGAIEEVYEKARECVKFRVEATTTGAVA